MSWLSETRRDYINVCLSACLSVHLSVLICRWYSSLTVALRLLSWLSTWLSCTLADMMSSHSGESRPASFCTCGCVRISFACPWEAYTLSRNWIPSILYHGYTSSKIWWYCTTVWCNCRVFYTILCRRISGSFTEPLTMGDPLWLLPSHTMSVRIRIVWVFLLSVIFSF